jgi:hypothetical protein
MAVFKRSAWLYSNMDKELSEAEFLGKLGKMSLKALGEVRFVTLILNNKGEAIGLVGHVIGRAIRLQMLAAGFGAYDGFKNPEGYRWQTMEFKQRVTDKK